MKKIAKVLVVAALSVLAACSSANTKKKVEVPKTENALKEFGTNLASAEMAKLVYWPSAHAEDSVRVTLDSKVAAQKTILTGLATAIADAEVKEVTEKPSLPQDHVVVGLEIDAKDITYNVAFFKEGYALYQNFKTGEKQVIQVSTDLITSLDTLAKTYVPAE